MIKITSKIVPNLSQRKLVKAIDEIDDLKKSLSLVRPYLSSSSKLSEAFNSIRKEIQLIRSVVKKDDVLTEVTVDLGDRRFSTRLFTKRILNKKPRDVLQFKKDCVSKLKDLRMASRYIVTSSKKLIRQDNGSVYLEYKKVAGVHCNSGDFIKAVKAKEAFRVFEPKKPLTSENHVGIEIEFCSPADKNKLASELAIEGVAKYVTLKTDGSLRPESGHLGHELCIVAPEDKIFDVLSKCCNVIKTTKGYANESCGLHVHIDMRNRDKETSFHNLVLAQGILYMMQPNSRRSNTYCKKTTSNKLSDFNVSGSGGGSDRYLGINPFSLSKHKTIECRIHSGTINYTKISNWVMLLLKITSRSNKLTEVTKKFHDFCTEFNVDAPLANYIIERTKKFKESGAVDDYKAELI